MNGAGRKLWPAAVLLAVLLGIRGDLAAQQDTAAVKAGTPRKIEVTVLGMSCPFCAYGVEQKLKRLDGIAELKVELKTGLATLTLEDGADVSNEDLLKAVRDAGFEVARITRNFPSEHPAYERKKKG